MERFLIFIKHNFTFFWKIIEWGNSTLFSLLFGRRLRYNLIQVFNEFDVLPFFYRMLETSDIKSLYELINSQDPADLKYFSPHSFDIKSLHKQSKNSAFIMMGTFDGEKLIGYFFLRFFVNKTCFVGRLIDKPYRGQGIGPVMNNIMYQMAWKIDFRCLSTISKNNSAIVRAHAKNQTMVLLKELKNDYILVEFKKDTNVSKATI